MDVLSYIIASRLLSCSGGNGANIKLDENGNIITDEDVALKYGYSYFPQKLSLDAYRYIAENGATFFRAYGMTDQELWDFMCHKAKVATDDGPKFGPNGEAGGFQRINFSCPRAQLEEALNRIAEALDAL